MTIQRNNKSRSARLLKRVLFFCLGSGMIATSCNSDSDDVDLSATGYVEPTDVAVTGFSLKKDVNILRGLDSVYFAIDLDRAVIYNADSLPKGTKVTDIIPVISYSNYISSAVIKMEGGQKRTGEIDYKSHPNDSVDFTGNVSLTLTSAAGNNRTYTLKVNVHQTDPDSLCWGETAVSTLPARSYSPLEQRTVKFKDKVTTLIKEADGSYTLSSTDSPSSSKWIQTSVTPPFTPRVRTLTATSEYLWILASDGAIYKSTDGLNWQSAGQSWRNIIGQYNDVLMGISSNDAGSYSLVSYGDTYPQVSLPADFPIEDFSNVYSYKSKWMESPVCVLCGGVTASGEVTSAVWAFDGSRWAKLSIGKTPALRGAVLVPYYTYRRTGTTWTYSEFSTVLMLGGINAKGEINRDTYVTYDNGVNWCQASSLLTLPDYIPAMWQIDHTLEEKPMQAPLMAGWKQMRPRCLPAYYRVNSSVDDGIISWECPYIYLYGGLNADGALYNTIWRGVINRLMFKPII
ncbi:MAG: DUF6242 domain-containing protein [Prevotella sp.]|nr:DUF6242 domain-containing protein [Prevotella sp.]MCM1074249.1 DUF6242 domain-containing protein [Ruminococcus sp.]